MSSEITTATTDLVYIPDHAARACAKLITQDQKPRTRALVEALSAGAQLLEDQIFDLLVGRRLEVAAGDALDQWGAIVGEKRLGLVDGDYRRFIRARILANTSKGSVDEIIAVWALVTGGMTVRYFPMYPAGYSMLTIRGSWLSAPLRRRVRRIMEDIRPAGVEHELVEALIGPYGYEESAAIYVLGYDAGTYARVL